jgi:hypothetical protein
MKTILAPMALSLVGLCVVATAASGQESANYVAKLMGLSLAGAEPQEKDNLEPTLAAAFAKIQGNTACTELPGLAAALVDAQDPGSVQSMNLNIVGVDDPSTAKVRVQYTGKYDSRQASHDITVEVRKSNGDWKIYDICNTNNSSNCYRSVVLNYRCGR